MRSCKYWGLPYVTAFNVQRLASRECDRESQEAGLESQARGCVPEDSSSDSLLTPTFLAKGAASVTAGLIGLS